LDKLRKRWELFFDVILDPWTLLLIISAILLFAFSIGQTNTTISSLFFVLITIASTILGGRITKHWVDITEGGVVIARGKSAVRGLKLLLRNISALEQRVAKCSDGNDEIEKHPEVTKRNYEEIREFCNLLEEETVNSIENWTDIVPEADIKTQIGIIGELKQSLQGKEEELEELNNELNDTKGKSEEDHNKLEAEVKKIEKQKSDLEREMVERKIGLGGLGAIGGLSGLGLIGGSNILDLDSRKIPTGLLGSGIIDVTGGSNSDSNLVINTKDEKSLLSG
jgi:hypothetical protein